VGDNRHLEAVGRKRVAGKTHAVDSHRALLDQPCQQFGGSLEGVDRRLALVAYRSHAAHAVNVTGYDVTTQAITHAQRALEVNRRTLAQVTKRRTPERLR